MFSIVYVLQSCVKWEGFLIKNSFNVRTKLNVLKNLLLRVEREVVSSKAPVLLCSQYAQGFIEKSPVLMISWVCKSRAANKILRWCSQGLKAVNKSVRDITVFTAYCSISSSTVRPVRLLDFIVPENKHFYFHEARQVELFMLHCFEFLSEKDFCQAKFIRGTVFSSTVIWSYATPFLT